MFTSNDALYLQRILSSKLYEYAYKHIFSSVALGIHGYQYNKHALVKLPVAKPDASWKKVIEDADINKIDEIVYSFYSISSTEVADIESAISQTDSM